MARTFLPALDIIITHIKELLRSFLHIFSDQVLHVPPKPCRPASSPTREESCSRGENLRFIWVVFSSGTSPRPSSAPLSTCRHPLLVSLYRKWRRRRSDPSGEERNGLKGNRPRRSYPRVAPQPTAATTILATSLHADITHSPAATVPTATDGGRTASAATVGSPVSPHHSYRPPLVAELGHLQERAHVLRAQRRREIGAGGHPSATSSSSASLANLRSPQGRRPLLVVSEARRTPRTPPR